MKEVFYIRHAKSSWDNPTCSDQERPLNERGHNIAPKMAEFLHQLYGKIKEIQFISSPAKRAFTTAAYFARVWKISKESININDSLYHGDESAYLRCLMFLQNETTTAFIFGHNPNIENLVAKIKNPYLGPVPTCGVFHTIIESNKWHPLNFQEIKLIEYYFPKLVL